MKVSVIIPSYKDPLSIKTIDSLLTTSELGNKLEIIAVLDGYWPSFELRGDPRVTYVHFRKNGGMREAINAGVAISREEFIMRTDEHCMFATTYLPVISWIMLAAWPPRQITTLGRLRQ